MASWQPLHTAPKDGTVLDLWVFGTGRLIYNVSWGSSGDRSPDWGPNGRYHHLSQTGWFHPTCSSVDAGGIYPEYQFSHWRLHEISPFGPDKILLDRHLLLLKLRDEAPTE